MKQNIVHRMLVRRNFSSLSFTAALLAAMFLLNQFVHAADQPECAGICSCLFMSPISLFGGDAAGLAINSKGELYVAENVDKSGVTPPGPLVVKVNREGEQERITPPGLLGDVTALAVDSQDNLYIADGNGYGAGQPFPLNRVWKVTRDQGITPFASVNDPTGLAVDASGSVCLILAGWRCVQVLASGQAYECAAEWLGRRLASLWAHDRPGWQPLCGRVWEPV